METITRNQQIKRRQEFWDNHIAGWKQSGLNIREYCRRNKINHNTFYCAKSRLSITERKSIPEFIEIPALSNSNAVGAEGLFELRIEEDQSICIRFSPELMRNLAGGKHVSR